MVEMTTTVKPNTITLGFNRIFKEANETKARYRILYGSAGSGKSVNIAQDYILKLGSAHFKGANLLVIRKTAKSNATSTFNELYKAILKIHGDNYASHWHITTTPHYMRNKRTGSEILFAGMNNKEEEEKAKSVTSKNGSITWIWIEEATELLESQVDVLDDRLRGLLDNPNLYYQLTLSFNPVSAMHWIKRKYVDGAGADTYIGHSTYKNNRFIDEAYYNRMERRKIEDPDGFRVYGLGEWGELGGLILTNYEIKDFIKEFEESEVALQHNLNYTHMFDYMVLAQDFGFNHANVILELGFKDSNIFVCRELVLYEHDTNEIIEKANSLNFDKRLKMYCDSAEPDRIKQFKKAGYRARGVKKEPNSVKAQIDHLKQNKIIIDPSCTHTIKEIQQWKYSKNKTTGLYEETPVNFFDDAMAALRYGIEQERKGEGLRALKPTGYY